MGNARSCVVASLSVCSVCLGCVYIYRSHKLLRQNALNSDKLPSFAYLYVKYLSRAVTRRAGQLYAARAVGARAVVYTVLNCRLDKTLLRRFCGAAGYGWDYPDTEFRDLPLCFPEVLCSRLMLMLLTDHNFRLSPAGLVRVRQSLKTLQPIDELKKGPFTLQVAVEGYQQTDAGVEVDVCLSAASRSGCPVWESVLTLLSQDRRHEPSRDLLRNEEEGPDDKDNMKQVEVRVPMTAGPQCVWPFTDYSPHRLLSLPAVFCGLKSRTAPGFWMLTVCLAEIEKRKGVEIVSAPVSVTAQFKETPPAAGTVTIRFWGKSKNAGRSADEDLSFQVQLQGQSSSHMVGLISRT
ncbi:uncharacterized protein LOC116729652 [Xiphophorus hellerii]|uniref:uncharacterized protein LOC116729652 n=1 Tax=Xiphophorus hellerii TaxID=8084 RepID=UPI0013B36A27|nr:uncharacterized protein LOC116729652 [Xiphophorus hellerii]